MTPSLSACIDASALDGLVDECVLAPSTATDLDESMMDGVDHVVSALGVTRQKADPWDIDFLLNLSYLELAEQSDATSFLYVGVMNADRGTSAVSRVLRLAAAQTGANQADFCSAVQARMEPTHQQHAPEMHERALRLLEGAKPEHPSLRTAIRRVAGLLGTSPEKLRVRHIVDARSTACSALI